MSGCDYCLEGYCTLQDEEGKEYTCPLADKDNKCTAEEKDLSYYCIDCGEEDCICGSEEWIRTGYDKNDCLR